MDLYQPIKFKRWELSKWETGWLMISDSGKMFLEEDKETKVDSVFEYKVSWF